MRIRLIVAAALAVAGFISPAQAAGCNVGVAKAWVPFKGAVYGSEAYSNGATCAGAVVTIVVRAPDGNVVWVDAAPAAQLMPFVDVKTPQRMQAGLNDWVSQQHPFKSTGDLPEWKKGADAPAMLGEFPFYAEPGVDQESYAQIRADRLAIFCYVQGMESMACVAIARDGSATKVGVQLFPG